MGNDYQTLKLTREQLLERAGYHKEQAVYRLPAEQGTKSTTEADRPGAVDA